MSDKLTEMNVTVLKQTKAFLDDMSENTGLTIGQLIDRIILEACPAEPESAALLMLDYIMITTRNLDSKSFNHALFEVLRVIDLSAQEGNDPEHIRELIQKLLDTFKLPEETGGQDCE